MTTDELKPSYVQPVPKRTAEPSADVQIRDRIGNKLNCFLSLAEHQRENKRRGYSPLTRDEAVRIYGWDEALTQWPDP